MNLIIIEQKALLKSYSQRQQAHPVSLTALQEMTNDIQFQQVQLVGKYDNSKQFLLDNRYYKRRLGYSVLTPFKPINGGAWILVDRGWIARGTSRTEIPTLKAITGQQTIEGAVYQPSAKTFRLGPNSEDASQWPQRVQQLDMTDLAQVLGRDLSPFVVRLNPNQSHGFVRDWPTVTMSPQRHRGYAIQWFALALTLSIIYLAVNTTRREH